jgi:hypothetical protein
MVYLIGRKRADAVLAIARQDPAARVVLLHEGIYLATPGLHDVVALQADVERAGIRPAVPLIDDARLLDLLLENAVLSHL